MKCSACQLEFDRDTNAAKNMANASGSGPWMEVDRQDLSVLLEHPSSPTWQLKW